MIELVEEPESLFKGLFFIGVVVAIISLFMNWYSFSILEADNHFTNWDYYYFLGWVCTTEMSDTIPSLFRMDIYFSLIYVAYNVFSLSAFVYVCINLSDSQKKNYYEKIRRISIVFFLHAGFNIIFSGIFFFELTQEALYFPNLILKNTADDSFISYNLGIGCILHVLSFPLIAPFSIFLHTIPKEFKVLEKERDIEDLMVPRYKQIDLDRMIQKQRIKSDSSLHPKLKEKIRAKEKFNLEQIELEGE